LSEGKGKEAIGRSAKLVRADLSFISLLLISLRCWFVGAYLMRLQSLQQSQKELTFHPHTNESRSKEILARILATE
jgi:hypothetical protein